MFKNMKNESTLLPVPVLRYFFDQNSIFGYLFLHSLLLKINLIFFLEAFLNKNYFD
jgi:hypothetical protein